MPERDRERVAQQQQKADRELGEFLFGNAV